MKKTVLKTLLVTGLVLTAVSCAFGPFMADIFGPQDALASGNQQLSVDSSGAKAVAGTSSSSRSGSRALGAKDAVEENAALVKFLDDGSVASVIDMGENADWAPSISFLSTGEDGSIYAGFEYIYWSGFYNAETLMWEQTGLQFIRIYPNSTDYDVLWPPEDIEVGNDVGQIDVWGWWGMDQDPLVKGPDGKLYFKVSNWSSTGSNDSIYCYDPDLRDAPEKVTPDNATLTISTFMVDAANHLFIQSADNWSGDSASYLRFYSSGETGYKNVYYSSGSDMWVRGYVTSPNGDYIVMNGYGIRDMNGIIKVSDFGETEMKYDLMYSNANNGGTWIDLYKYYDDNWENNTELIDMTLNDWVATAFEWRDDVKTSDNVDIAKIYTKIQPYFNGTVTVKAGKEDFVTGILAEGLGAIDPSPDAELTLDEQNRELWRWITSYPEDFLTTYFDGTLFKDWLSDNGMTDLYFDNIGSMLWASDNSLYGLYDSGWWGSGDSVGTKVVKLLNASSERDLAVITLNHSDRKPSMIKIEGDYLYYRYAILDSYDQETGKHQLARLDITDAESEEEVLPADLNDKYEIISYDVSSDNEVVYFLGADGQTNEIVNGKIDLTSSTWSKIDTTLKFTNIKVIE